MKSLIGHLQQLQAAYFLVSIHYGNIVMLHYTLIVLSLGHTE